jgi:glutathione peroxidase
MATPVSAADSSTAEHTCSLSFTAKSIDGESVDLHDYEGQVVLIVNVASQCGYTKQYAGLQELYEKYKDQGLVILGFPCNEFGSQEPGSDADIKQFCTTKFGVTFPMMSKVEVNTEGACDLYKHLTSQETTPAGKGKIKWNFEKFLIGRDGQVVNRFGSSAKPNDTEMTTAIEAQLAKKAD